MFFELLIENYFQAVGVGV